MKDSFQLTVKNALRIVLGIFGILLIAIIARNIIVPKERLRLLIWENYLGEQTIADFERESHAKVIVEYYNSNEEMLLKLQARPAYYDIAVPSDYMVNYLREGNFINFIDPSKVPNQQYIDASARGHYYDPMGQFSVPYAFGSTGFAVNTTHVKDQKITWNTLAEERFKGRVLIMDDMRYVLGSVLLELGLNPNTRNPQDLAKAVALLKKVLPNVRQISVDSQVDLMTSEEAWVAYDYNGDIYQMQAENPAIAYVIPEKGSMQFYDAMVMPVNGPNPALATRFINYIHRPRVSAAISNATHYATPNSSALSFVDKSLRMNPTIYPSKATIKKLHFVRDMGDAITLYEDSWNEILDQFASTLPSLPIFFDE